MVIIVIFIVIKEFRNFENINSKFTQDFKEKDPRTILSFFQHIIQLVPMLNRLFELKNVIKLSINFWKKFVLTLLDESAFIKNLIKKIEDSKLDETIKGKNNLKNEFH